MRVSVEILTGGVYYVEVEKEESTVHDLREAIGAQHKLPSDRLIMIPSDNLSRLITRDHDQHLLVDCGIRDGSHLYLFFSPIDDDTFSFGYKITSRPPRV